MQHIEYLMLYLCIIYWQLFERIHCNKNITQVGLFGMTLFMNDTQLFKLVGKLCSVDT